MGSWQVLWNLPNAAALPGRCVSLSPTPEPVCPPWCSEATEQTPVLELRVSITRTFSLGLQTREAWGEVG